MVNQYKYFKEYPIKFFINIVNAATIIGGTCPGPGIAKKSSLQYFVSSIKGLTNYVTNYIFCFIFIYIVTDRNDS